MGCGYLRVTGCAKWFQKCQYVLNIVLVDIGLAILFVSVVAVDRWAVSLKKLVHLVVDILFYRISCQSQRD